MADKLKPPLRKQLKVHLGKFHPGQKKFALGMWYRDKPHIQEVRKAAHEDRKGALSAEPAL